MSMFLPMHTQRHCVDSRRVATLGELGGRRCRAGVLAVEVGVAAVPAAKTTHRGILGQH